VSALWRADGALTGAPRPTPAGRQSDRRLSETVGARGRPAAGRERGDLTT
jgi:hypothetical protein